MGDPDLNESTDWTKEAVSEWSGRPIKDILLATPLGLPPMPGDREILRKKVNKHFKAHESTYQRIGRAKWGALVNEESTVETVRDICHARRR